MIIFQLINHYYEMTITCVARNRNGDQCCHIISVEIPKKSANIPRKIPIDFAFGKISQCFCQKIPRLYNLLDVYITSLVNDLNVIKIDSKKSPSQCKYFYLFLVYIRIVLQDLFRRNKFTGADIELPQPKLVVQYNPVKFASG